MHPEIPNIRDDELIALIRKQNSDSESADSAWLELYSRHAAFVYGCLLKSSFTKLGDRLNGRGIDEADIVEQTFTRVYVHAAQTFTAGNYANDEDASRHVRKWLNQIARTQLLQSIEKRKPVSLTAEDPRKPDRLATSDVGEFAPDDERANLRRIANNVLTEEESKIVWFKMQYYDRDTGESRPPDDERKTFCNALGISVNQLRTKYHRALEKVEEALQAAKTR